MEEVEYKDTNTKANFAFPFLKKIIRYRKSSHIVNLAFNVK